MTNLERLRDACAKICDELMRSYSLHAFGSDEELGDECARCAREIRTLDLAQFEADTDTVPRSVALQACRVAYNDGINDGPTMKYNNKEPEEALAYALARAEQEEKDNA
jgi:hypothetical protein